MNPTYFTARFPRIEKGCEEVSSKTEVASE